jgi:hypothetical protein
LNIGKGNEAALLKQEAEEREYRYAEFLGRGDDPTTYPYSEAADAVLKYLMGPRGVEHVYESGGTRKARAAWEVRVVVCGRPGRATLPRPAAMG